MFSFFNHWDYSFQSHDLVLLTKHSSPSLLIIPSHSPHFRTSWKVIQARATGATLYDGHLSPSLIILTLSSGVMDGVSWAVRWACWLCLDPKLRVLVGSQDSMLAKGNGQHIPLCTQSTHACTWTTTFTSPHLLTLCVPQLATYCHGCLFCRFWRYVGLNALPCSSGLPMLPARCLFPLWPAGCVAGTTTHGCLEVLGQILCIS